MSFTVIGRRKGGKNPHPVDVWPLRLVIRREGCKNGYEYGWTEKVKSGKYTARPQKFNSPEEAGSAVTELAELIRKRSRVAVEIEHKIVTVDQNK